MEKVCGLALIALALVGVFFAKILPVPILIGITIVCVLLCVVLFFMTNTESPIGMMVGGLCIVSVIASCTLLVPMWSAQQVYSGSFERGLAEIASSEITASLFGRQS